jgi:hypothetical protein
MNTNTAYYGNENFSGSRWIKLAAGPLTLLYQNGIISSIQFGEFEIVQRIYMALRDEFWNTVHPQITPVLMENDSSSFRIIFKALHRERDINFLWRGELCGEKDGTLCYSMHGEALSTFKRNRIGFCVLHPLELCAGRACIIRTTEGKTKVETFPVFISPCQPFKDIRQLSYKISSYGSVSILFEGDTFEMEDQRNWTDASFKTYSTPLSEPFPVTITQGTIIEQSVTLKIETLKPLRKVASKPLEIRIPYTYQNLHSLPRIGVSHAPKEQLTPFAVEMIQQLSLSHLRCEIEADSSSIISEMENYANHCVLLGIPSELAIYFTSDYQAEIQLILKALRVTQIPVSTFLIYRKDQPVASPETISHISAALRSYNPMALIGSGTDSYFVEINRNHPDTQQLDLMCYSATPQVHTFDNDAIMSNLPGIAETLRTAALFQGRARPAISTLSLRPRNRFRPQKFGGADIRQQGLFGASWLLGAIMHCIAADAASVTFSESIGPAGLIPSHKEAVYPLYHIMASIGDMRGSMGRICSCSEPNRIASVALFSETSMMLLVANLTDTVQQVTIFDLPESITFVSLDENSFEQATLFPLLWRCKKGEQRSSNGPFHIFDILPYAVLRIEAPVIL